MSAKNLKKELEKFVSQDTMAILSMCSEAAEKLSLRIFLIGGTVRDIIINSNHCEAGVKSQNENDQSFYFDTDITVQGNAVDFAYYLEEVYPDICKIKEIHEKFKTAKMIFCGLRAESEIEIDIASTRKESYSYPGSLPNVEEIGCELYEDAKRRDFSINSLALSLNKEKFGDLTDYLGGYDDIKKEKIRVLHEKSFIDDPTRIIRALKFRVRFNYKLDELTKKLQDKCLASGMFDNICGERIKSELKQSFNINKSEIMEIFIHENIYRLIDKDIKIPENIEIIAKTCESAISEYFKYRNPDFIWLIWLGVIISEFSKEKIKNIVENLYLSGPETSVLTEAKELFGRSDYLKNKISNFEIYESFEGISSESILILLMKKPELKEKIDLYFKDLRDIKIFTTGQTLVDLGLKPGPVFSKILRKLLKARINKEFFSEEEEKNSLLTLISLK